MKIATNSNDLIDRRIVLIADRTFLSHTEANVDGNTLEMISNEYFETVFTALTRIGHHVVHYNSTEELIDNAALHQNDLVFTIYGGSSSRNRMALVPAICEGYKIKFVGADTYARIVCQDKFLSKVFARRFGIPSPASVLVDANLLKDLIEDLRFPVVVKPNFEGSSIGITKSSKATTIAQAMVEIERQQKLFEQPILVEEFVPGKEVSICVIGTGEEIRLFDAMEVFFEEDETFLYDQLYTAEEKHQSDKTVAHRSVLNELDSDQQNRLRSMYRSLGKMDFMRIDGRIDKGLFTLIELTPDGYIGEDSSFADAYQNRQLSYEELLGNIIHSALAYYQTPYSNYIKS